MTHQNEAESELDQIMDRQLTLSSLQDEMQTAFAQQAQYIEQKIHERALPVSTEEIDPIVEEQLGQMIDVALTPIVDLMKERIGQMFHQTMRSAALSNYSRVRRHRQRIAQRDNERETRRQTRNREANVRRAIINDIEAWLRSDT